MSAQSAPEQSMEDILASIRKIISDDGIEEAVADAQPNVVPDNEVDVQANNESDNLEPASPVVLVERRENLDDNFLSSEDDTIIDDTIDIGQFSAKTSEIPVTSKDVTTGDPQTPVQVQVQENIDTSELHPAIANAMAFVATGEGQKSPTTEKPVFAGNANDTPQIAERSLVSPDDSDRRGEDERRNHPLRRGADRGDHEFKSALMSPTTNSAIANSFEQLKASATDGLDDKVETMLRPMLREWMDNNLPSMVERLVRDEIERVSRGE